MNDQADTDTDTDQTDQTDQSDQSDQTDAREGNEADVPGLSLDPDDGNKSLEVDTNVRLDQKNKHLDDVPEDELHQERDERLDPDNRPESTEVDNSDRTFNPETGLFEDSDIEPPDGAPFATTDAEQSNKDGSDGDGSDGDGSDDTDSDASDRAEDTQDSEDSEDSEDSDEKAGGKHAAR